MQNDAEVLQTRLASIEGKISDNSFLQNKGLGNEVGYFIFDYNPKFELDVRKQIDMLVRKFNDSSELPDILCFDLYDIVIDLFKQKGFLEKTFQMENTKGSEFAYNAAIKSLRLTDENNNPIVNYIKDKVQPHSIVFITGVGKVYPLVRSHTILNNLQPKIESVPVVMFYPGEYTGQELKLFNKLKDDNYYRAIPLCPEHESKFKV